MAYIKIRYVDQEIELTPEAIRELSMQVVAQYKNVTFDELVDIGNGLGLPMAKMLKLLAILKE